MKSQNRVALHIHAKVKPEHIDAFKIAANKTSDIAITEEACILINTYQNPDNPGEFVLYEEWSDKEYLLSDAHQKSEHIQRFFETTIPMLEEDYQYAIYDILSEKKGVELSIESNL
ncbi:MAG: putative quinol monooxygenase [Bacteroidota bacterium]